MSTRQVLGIPCPAWCMVDAHDVDQLPAGDDGDAPGTACEAGSVSWGHDDGGLLVRYDAVSEDGARRTVGTTYVRVGDDRYLTCEQAREHVSAVLAAVEAAEGEPVTVDLAERPGLG